MKEKFIDFPHNHQLLNKEDHRENIYCKYHNSWNHSTNSFWSFRNITQDKINKGILKSLGEKEAMVIFPREKEVMVIGEDTFPLVASINTVAFDLKAVMNSKKVRGIPLSPRIRKVWIPKQYLTYKNDLDVERKVSVVRENKNGGLPIHSFGK